MFDYMHHYNTNSQQLRQHPLFTGSIDAGAIAVNSYYGGVPGRAGVFSVINKIQIQNTKHKYIVKRCIVALLVQLIWNSAIFLKKRLDEFRI